jgi:DNA (cytosine-5)-methyltransferase 1
MALYGIADIRMRMLKVQELLKIQGFPENYRMVGNQSDHKKFIGNSVEPNVVKAWVEALAGRLQINLQKQA